MHNCEQDNVKGPHDLPPNFLGALDLMLYVITGLLTSFVLYLRTDAEVSLETSGSGDP